jgi:hypothetical protein
MKEFSTETKEAILKRLDELQNADLLSSVAKVREEFRLSHEEVSFFVELWSKQ